MSTDSEDIDEFGYKPSLVRSLGSFHTFAAGISYISILTGTFQLFYFGLGSGGPAYWWPAVVTVRVAPAWGGRGGDHRSIPYLAMPMSQSH